MVEMVCPITGVKLYVDETRVEKYEKAGYKKAAIEPKKRGRKPAAENEE